MKLIIAGSRSIKDNSKLESALRESDFNLSKIDKIITGGAEGVDELVIDYCLKNKINFEVVFPDYDKFENKKVAPIKRNERMSKMGDALLAVWDGKSKGTKSMINKAKSKNLDIYVYNTGTDLTDFD